MCLVGTTLWWRQSVQVSPSSSWSYLFSKISLSEEKLPFEDISSSAWSGMGVMRRAVALRIAPGQRSTGWLDWRWLWRQQWWFWSGMCAPPSGKGCPAPRKKQVLPRPAKIGKSCGAGRGKVDLNPCQVYRFHDKQHVILKWWLEKDDHNHNYEYNTCFLLIL